jgi:hypothetical protein
MRWPAGGESPLGDQVRGSRRGSRALAVEDEARVPLEVVIRTIAKDLSRNFFIRRRVRVRLATKARHDVSLPRLSSPPARRDLVLHLDAGKASRLEPPNQVSLIPADQRSPPVALASLVELADLSPLRLKFVIKSASADPTPDLLSDFVDGFEDGRAPAGLQHTVDFPNRPSCTLQNATCILIPPLYDTLCAFHNDAERPRSAAGASTANPGPLKREVRDHPGWNPSAVFLGPNHLGIA